MGQHRCCSMGCISSPRDGPERCEQLWRLYSACEGCAFLQPEEGASSTSSAIGTHTYPHGHKAALKGWAAQHSTHGLLRSTPLHTAVHTQPHPRSHIALPRLAGGTQRTRCRGEPGAGPGTEEAEPEGSTAARKAALGKGREGEGARVTARTVYSRTWLWKFCSRIDTSSASILHTPAAPARNGGRRRRACCCPPGGGRATMAGGSARCSPRARPAIERLQRRSAPPLCQRAMGGGGGGGGGRAGNAASAPPAASPRSDSAHTAAAPPNRPREGRSQWAEGGRGSALIDRRRALCLGVCLAGRRELGGDGAASLLLCCRTWCLWKLSFCVRFSPSLWPVFLLKRTYRSVLLNFIVRKGGMVLNWHKRGLV